MTWKRITLDGCHESSWLLRIASANLASWPLHLVFLFLNFWRVCRHFHRLLLDWLVRMSWLTGSSDWGSCIFNSHPHFSWVSRSVLLPHSPQHSHARHLNASAPSRSGGFTPWQHSPAPKLTHTITFPHLLKTSHWFPNLPCVFHVLSPDVHHCLLYHSVLKDFSKTSEYFVGDLYFSNHSSVCVTGNSEYLSEIYGAAYFYLERVCRWISPIQYHLADAKTKRALT